MPTATPFNNLITFSRGSNATVTGSNGLIQWAPNNLLTFSEQFDNAAWTKEASATITANTLAAPDGTITADRLNMTAQFQGVRQTVTVATGVLHTMSIWARRSSGTNELSMWNQSAGTLIGNFSPTSEWQRFSFSFTPAAASLVLFPIQDRNASGWTNVEIWGAQLEIGSTATTYNPTTVKNLLGFSEAFSDASWTKVAASIVTGAQANPINGLFNAQKFMEGTANAQYAVFRSVAVGAAPHTFSMYAKLAPGTPRFFCLYPQGAGVAWAIFDLALGTTTAVSAINYISSSITPVGSGWYRCSITLNTTASNLFCNAYLTNSSGTPAPSYTGDGNSGVYIYGAQLSDSASLDPYVPTPGAAPSSTAFYGPRFDFDPVTLQPRGLLVEEQRTNLTVRSDNFADAVWTKASATITSNTDTAPDGTLTADTFAATATNGEYYQQVTSTSGTAHTGSIYVKRKTGTGNIFLVDPAGGRTLVTTPVNSTTWTRISVTANSVSVNPFFGVRLATSGDELYVWGAQLELGAFATSYIPTVASTVTRSADVATISGSLFAQWYSQTAGSFVAEWALANANTTGRYIVKAFSPSVAQGYGLWVNSNSIDTRAWIGATSITAGNASLTVANKASMGYRAGDNAASVNGAAAVASSATGPTDATYLEIGSAGASYLNGHIRSIDFIPARAADFQLQGLTT